MAAIPTTDGLLVVGDEVWEGEARTVEGNLTVTSGSTLTIRGIEVTLSRTHLLVDVGGALILESTHGAPAILRAEREHAGWSGRVLGEFRIAGTPAHPAVLAHMGGFGAFSAGGAAAFQQGFTVAGGAFTAERAVFRNYTSGIYIGGGSGAFRDVTFASDHGVGLLSSATSLEVTNATFQGRGGNLFLTVSPHIARLRDLTFQDTDVPLTLRESRAEVDGFHASNVTTCISIPGGNFTRVELRGVTCEGFRRHAIEVAGPSRGTTRGAAEVAVHGLRARTEHPAEAVVHVAVANLTLHDAVVGPANATGLHARMTIPVLREAAFRDVGGFNAVLDDPPLDADLAPFRVDEPGDRGRVLVARTATFLVVDALGSPVEGARVEMVDLRTGEIAGAATTRTGGYATFPLTEALRVTSGDEVSAATYLVRASHPSAGEGELAGFVPSGRLATLPLEARGAPLEGSAAVPALGAMGLVAAGLVAAAALRRT